MSWDLGPSYNSWGIMANTIKIWKSNQLSLFMYVMSLICDFGAFDEVIVSSLTIWSLSALENAS